MNRNRFSLFKFKHYPLECTTSDILGKTTNGKPLEDQLHEEKAYRVKKDNFTICHNLQTSLFAHCTQTTKLVQRSVFIRRKVYNITEIVSGG